MIEPSFQSYYHKIINNLNSNEIFYKYFDQEKKYKEAYLLLKKIIRFIKIKSDSNTKKNIYVSCDKSFFMYVSIIAILLTNNIWIPLSKNLPKKRIREILKNVPPDMFICDGYDELDNFTKYTKKIFLFKSITKQNFKKININFNSLVNKINFNETAFIYFTSGSTGVSKGIKVSHKNIISDVFAQVKHLHNFSLQKKNTKLVFGDYYDTAFSIFFDIFFPAIYLRAAISPGLKKEEILLPVEHFVKNKVNVLVAVPSTIQRIMIYFEKKKIDHEFETIIMTGEPFYLNVLKYLLEFFKSKKYFNCYGGTEMGNWVYYHQCKKSDLMNYKKFNLVPIGKPFFNVKSKVIKRELVVTGPMITLGYVNTDLNINKFFFDKKNSTFFTGDLVIELNNNLVCIGRKDFQVKIRGYRIELPFVEAKLRSIKLIDQCIVIEKKSKSYENYLIGIIKPIDKNVKIEEISKLLKKELSDYMIPSKIVLINNFPLNSNGKLDRKKIIKKFQYF
jgi:D-alanine--poly(phosphoribitol) ligase subunit 1